MKALSLWQPWASAVALGSKRIETRSWSTNYRGPLLIHAAKRCVRSEMMKFDQACTWQGALWPLLQEPYMRLEQRLPFGSIVATAALLECRPVEEFDEYELMEERWNYDAGAARRWCEDDMGDFTPGRFGWVLGGIRQIEPTISYRGRQGLFEIPDDLPGLAGAIAASTPHPSILTTTGAPQ